MNFSGIARDDFNTLMRQAMLDTIKQVDQVHHGKVLQRMVALAEERDIDIARLRYATMDNTLWFPAWVGEGGAADFHWQVSHAPVAKSVTRSAVAFSEKDPAKDEK